MKVGHHAMTWQGWWKKNEVAFDLERLFSEVRECGYDGVEIGYQEAPDTVKELLGRYGLALPAVATSVTADPYPPNTEQYRRAMDFAAAMGVDIIMVCGGFLPEARRTTFDSDYELFAQNLDAAAAYARQYGQVIAYHPHCGCIVETTEEVDRLFRFEPDVQLCIDTGHLIAAGSDPVELMRKYPDRVIYTHVKDWDREGRCFMELGRGRPGLDFPGLIAALREIGYDGWLMVERDNSPMPPAESAKISRDFLRSLGF